MLLFSSDVVHDVCVCAFEFMLSFFELTNENE